MDDKRCYWAGFLRLVGVLILCFYFINKGVQ